MIAKNGSYFSSALLVGGHYIITGDNDNYIDDLLMTVDIRQKLHQELMEHDFDVVLFCDYTNRMYCYDARSFYLLKHANDDSEEANVQSSSVRDTVLEMGIFGGAFFENVFDEPEPQTANESGTYNERYADIRVLWSNVIALLRQTKYRVGIVFPNISGFTNEFPTEALEALTELTAICTDRPHAAFYIFRAERGAEFSRYAEIGNDAWAQFYRQILQPLFDTNDPEQNRVIALPSANAAEISNLLNAMALRDEHPLRFDALEMRALAEGIAYACATNNRPLKAAYTALQEFTREHPGKLLTVENYQQILCVKEQKTALEMINGLIGLENVKNWIGEWAVSRREDGLERSFPQSSSRFSPLPDSPVKDGLILNLVLAGNPGTGKSTIAEQLGRLYYELGLLPKGHLVTCSAANLVSPHIGETARVVRQRVMEALGGVLMIDEAYALKSSAHGREAIDQLVNEMTQYKGQFAVVICGYDTPMKSFLAANPGLASRFGTTLHLEDYSAEEMEEIFRRFMENDDMTLTMDDELSAIFGTFCDNWANDHGNKWGNAREAGNLLADMKRRALARIREAGERVVNNSLILTKADIPSTHKRHLKPRPKNMAEIRDELEATIGLANVKTRILKIAQDTAWDVKKNPSAGRYIFHGPPGTGKTHMARLFGNLLFRLGRIKRNYVYEVSAKQLEYPDPEIDYGKSNGEQPSISEIVEQAFENAKGGILFIDEAHQFLDEGHGESILRAIVPILDRPEIYETTCVILAGYTDKITALLCRDDGLQRRFPKLNRIRFDNYTAKELADLSKFFAEEKYGHTVLDEDGFYERTRAAFSAYLEKPEPNFGNAGFIRDTYIPAAIEKKSERLSEEWLHDKGAIASREDVRNIELATRAKLTERDIPEPFDLLAGPVGLPVPPEKSVWDRVAQLVGKEEIKEYLNSRRGEEDEQRFYDVDQSTACHYAIVGPVGTGRHTVARVVAAVLKENGVIDRDELHITSKGSFEAEHVGQTVPKTLGEIEKAKGGCLLVENASSMLPKNGNDNSFGPEALNTIAGAMRNSLEKLAVIFIDTAEGFELLTKQFPEIVSSFTRVFHLEDLSPDEMYSLFRSKTEHAYTFEKSLDDLLPDFFINWVSKRGGLKEDAAAWSNGTEVDKLLSEIKSRWEKANGQTDRSTKVPKRIITAELFPKWSRDYITSASEDKNQALQKLKDLTGLEGVKSAVEAIARKHRLFKTKIPPGFYAFTGDPGSGKTMVANLFGGVLRGAEALAQGHVVVRTAKQLSAEPWKFDECLKLAKNGIFFIDEAPQLRETDGGYEVIKKLLTTVEDTEIMKNVCIILAGYEDAMMSLFETDIGFKSRFERDNAIIHFDNYTADEMMEIMDSFAQRADTDSYLNCPYKLDVSDAEFRAASKAIFEVERKRPNFGNARFVRNYLDRCINKLLERADAAIAAGQEADEELLSTFTAADIPEYFMKRAEAQILTAVIPKELLCTTARPSITKSNYEDTLDEIRRGTVLIRGKSTDGKPITATGFIISEQGHVLTCHHVAANAESLRAKVYCPGAVGGNYRWFDCTLMEPNYPDVDMAMIKMKGSNFEPLSIRPADEAIGENEETLLVGFPLTGELNGGNLDTLNSSKYDGKISAHQVTARGGRNVDIYCIDSSGMPGNSGSAVISMSDGRVIGIFPGAIGENKTNVQPFMFPIKYFWGRFVQ